MPTKSLLNSGVIVALYTFLSRVLGLIRELFIAAMFGVGPIADAVNVAFKLPNLFRRIFAEGALSSVFIPIFNRKLLESKESAEVFSSKIFIGLLVVLVTLIVLMQIAMPYAMIIIAPGFNLSQDKFDMTVLLCRITIPYIIFISLSSLLGGILNSINKFAAFAFVPVLLNIAVIFGTMILEQTMSSAEAISCSVILGGALQLLFMWICMRHNSMNINLATKPHFKDPDVSMLLALMIPATISSGAAQLNLFISQSIASFIPGAVSILSYAERIYQFPLSIIGIAFGTILLPTLTKLYKQGDKAQISMMQNNAIKFALFLSIPCSTGIIILSHEIIHIIYEHGAFTSSDTINTAKTMAAFALGLPAFILTKIFMPIFYANHDTKTPMKITIYSLTINTLLNIALMAPFDYVGIALGSSVAAWYNVWLLARYAKKHGYLSTQSDLVVFVFKVCVCCTVLACAVLALNLYMHEYHYADSIMTQILSMTATIAVGGSTYLIAAFSLNMFGYRAKNDRR